MSAADDYGERWFTVREVAEHWRVSTKTVMRLIKKGRLAHVRIGKQIRVRYSTVASPELNDGTNVT